MSVNGKLSEDLHKPIIKQYKIIKVYSRFKYKLWAAYLAETRSLSSRNQNVKYLLCVIGAFTKYSWV